MATRMLDLDWVRGRKIVGLTAGASAPEELVLDVIAALRQIDDVEVTQMNGTQARSTQILTFTGLKMGLL